jgi:flagellar protein FliO/FliZ
MDLALAFRALAALIAVLGLIGLAAVAARRLKLLPALTDPRAARRLAILESLVLDARRRLVIVRREKTAHLLLLGPAGDRLIESFEAGETDEASNIVRLERGRKPPGADTQ